MFRLQFVSTRYARTQTRPSVSTPQNEKNRRKAPEKQHINTQQTTKKTSKHKKTRVIQTSLLSIVVCCVFLSLIPTINTAFHSS